MKTRFFAGLIVLSALLLLASVNVHPRYKMFTWESEIWADRAGYYMYLPAVFLYDLDTRNAPPRIDEKTGFGFRINKEKNKFETKYNYGVSLLISPLFAVTHFGARILDIRQDGGFGFIYHRMIDFSGILFLALGLWMLNLFLARYLKEWIRYLVLLVILSGTNLFYYSVIDPLMSHVYSFFLFSAFLLTCTKFLERRTIALFILLSLIIALITLIRPTNLLIFLVFFFWDLDSWNDFRERLRLFFRPVHLLIFLAAFVVIFLPQMLYWKYLHDSYFVYSYAGESFSNWNDPKIPEIFFSTLNGLFLYSPVVFLMLAGIIFMIVKKQKNGILPGILFIILSYVIASWYNWYYGCSFGQRSYVEFYTILSVPLGFLLKEIIEMRRKIAKIMLLLLVVFFVFFNVKLSFAYQRCFFGSTWDWPGYSFLLGNAGFGSNKGKQIIITNDFENLSLAGESLISTDEHHSGMYSARAIPEKSTTWLYWIYFGDIPDSLVSRVDATLWILNKQPDPAGAMLVFSIEKDGKALKWEMEPLDESTGKGFWTETKAEFRIPSEMDDSTLVKLYVWNKEQRTFFIDDIQLRFK